MNKYFLTLTLCTLALLGVATPVGAQTTIRTLGFSKQLVARWIAAYQAQHPEATLTLVDDPQTEADITLVPSTTASTGTGLTVSVARYALLPVTTKANSRLGAVTRRSLGQRDLAELFFEAQLDDEDMDWEPEENRRWQGITVYTTNGRYAAAHALAAHFGRDYTQIKGKKIAGDDRYLLQAMERSPESVTFLYPSYLYDLDSRQLLPDLTLLPLKVKKDQEAALESGDLDRLLTALEEQTADIIPVGEIEMRLSILTPEANAFIAWVIDEGQALNHQGGFLRVDEKVARSQQQELAYLANVK